MERLASDQKAAWNEALAGEASRWVAFGLDASVPLLSDRIRGFSALIDWRLHGQVSRLCLNSPVVDEFCLFPLPAGGQNFLLYNFPVKPDANAFLNRLKKLGVDELCLAESTFPKDFLSKLKQNLERVGIRLSKLEPDA